MRSVTSKSAMTPSLSGRTATMFPGVLPIIRLASTPTATIWPVLVLRATTDGSERTIPRPRTYTRVFAVPRSTAISRPPKPVIEVKMPMTAFESTRVAGNTGDSRYVETTDNDEWESPNDQPDHQHHRLRP